MGNGVLVKSQSANHLTCACAGIARTAAMNTHAMICGARLPSMGLGLGAFMRMGFLW